MSHLALFHKFWYTVVLMLFCSKYVVIFIVMFSLTYELFHNIWGKRDQAGSGIYNICHLFIV